MLATWLAASCCTAAVALTATDAAGTLEKILLELLLLLLVQLTLQKGGFRQGNPMLLKGDSDCCCCCCAHKDTALPDGETPWPWRTNGVQNKRFPRPERPFWNLLEKACYTFLNAGYWLAAVALTATDAAGTLENPRKNSIGAAAAADAADRTGKHHGPEGRTNPRIAPKKFLTSLLKPIENDDFSYFCCCCACCGSSPKQDSKVLFPGALPLASAGVGGY